MVLENGVENIQDMAYNGARTVYVCVNVVRSMIPCNAFTYLNKQTLTNKKVQS